MTFAPERVFDGRMKRIRLEWKPDGGDIIAGYLPSDDPDQTYRVAAVQPIRHIAHGIRWEATVADRSIGEHRHLTQQAAKEAVERSPQLEEIARQVAELEQRRRRAGR